MFDEKENKKNKEEKFLIHLSAILAFFSRVYNSLYVQHTS